MSTEEMKEDPFATLGQKALSYFKAHNYSEAMAINKQLLVKYEEADPSEITPKDRLVCLWRILTSIHSLYKDMEGSHSKDQIKEEQSYYERYMEVIQSVPQTEIVPDVILTLFSNRLSFLLPWEETDPDTLNRVATQLQTMLAEFLEKTQGRVLKRDLCDRWMQVLEKVRRNVGRGNFHKMVFFLAESFLSVLGEDKDFAHLRSSVYNLLADTAYFFSEQDTTDQERFSLVGKYLEKSLENDPTSQFAKTMENNIRRLETTTLQIRGFRHDTRSRIGKISGYLDRFKHLEGEAVQQNIAAIRSEVEVLQALIDLHEISGNIVGSLSIDSSVEEDIAPFIEEHVSVLRPLFARAPIKRQGAPDKWRFGRGQMGIVLQNLVANSDEAYVRRELTIPDPPCEFIVDYMNSRVIYRDFAGGVKIAGNIFEAYVSEKGVQSDRGLGLPQASRAMLMQGYKLIYDPDNQPDHGAEFIMDFTVNL